MQALIIDDTEANQKLFRLLVEKLEDTEPVCFNSAQAALEWCQHNDPDVVIVDYMMPAPNGIEFLKQFRLLPGKQDTPAIMITASNLQEVRYQALAAGANDFLTKPIDVYEFHARIRNMLTLRSNQKKLADHAAWLTEEIRKATTEIRAREREIVIRLSRAAEFRDPETGAHIQRMSHYSRLIARQLGLPQAEQELILETAPMHDVGKVGISDSILLKPGKLTPEEFEIMKQHAEIGYQILSQSDSPVLQAAATIARSHHEKFDGSGYPKGLKGEAIPLYGRIVAVADVFDALTSARPYKPSWELERATGFIRSNSGTHFDPTCVEAFFSAWEEALHIRDTFQDEQTK